MKIEKEIEEVFRFMIPKEEHKEHIPEYLKDCREKIKRIYELGIIEGKRQLRKKLKMTYSHTLKGGVS